MSSNWTTSTDSGRANTPDVVKITATVVEHTKRQMELTVKKKRRKGYKKTIQHKQTYTRLQIGPLEFPPQLQLGQSKV
jgi:ribosomal protein L21